LNKIQVYLSKGIEEHIDDQNNYQVVKTTLIVNDKTKVQIITFEHKLSGDTCIDEALVPTSPNP
jgi:hypothetical protein